MTGNLLQNPDLLDLLIKETEKGGIVSNEKAKKHIFLAGISTLNLNPDRTLHVIVEGPAGIGKTSLVKSVLSIFPEKKILERSRVSPKAFDHMGQSLDRTVVFIEELSGNEGSYSTKILISEHILKIDVVGKSGDGHGTETKKLSAKGTSFITTTTQKAFDKELESRIIRIYPDSSEEYISKAVESILDKAENPESNQHSSTNGADLKYIRAELDSLKSCGVIIPFSKALFNTEGFKKQPNVMRKLKKILGVIEAHALLHQEQREKQGEYIIAKAEDYLATRDLIQDIVTPPSNLRLQLENGLNKPVLTVDDIKTIYQQKQSAAYHTLKELRVGEVITPLGGGKYAINKVELPTKEAFPDIPLVSTVRQSTSDTEDNSTNSDGCIDSGSFDHSNLIGKGDLFSALVAESLEILENYKEEKKENASVEPDTTVLK